jgi:hypothetical protein
MASTSASNSGVKPDSLPNQSGSIWTTRPSGQRDPRGSDLEVAFVLEEVEVPQPLGLSVMDPMQLFDPRLRKPAAGDKVDADRQDLAYSVKINTSHAPRVGNAEGGFK